MKGRVKSILHKLLDCISNLISCLQKSNTSTTISNGGNTEFWGSVFQMKPVQKKRQKHKQMAQIFHKDSLSDQGTNQKMRAISPDQHHRRLVEYLHVHFISLLSTYPLSYCFREEGSEPLILKCSFTFRIKGSYAHQMHRSLYIRDIRNPYIVKAW